MVASCVCVKTLDCSADSSDSNHMTAPCCIVYLMSSVFLQEFHIRTDSSSVSRLTAILGLGNKIRRSRSPSFE